MSIKRAASDLTQEQHTMKSTLRKHLTAALSRCCTIAVFAGLSVAVQAQPAGITAEAKQLLKSSTDFLTSQQHFSADTRNTLEIVLKSGQKIEFNHTARQSVQRPNKLRAERTGDLVDQVFIYDGKSLTLYNPQRQYFSPCGSARHAGWHARLRAHGTRHRRAGRRHHRRESLRDPY
ncbi:MAG: DUF2092 domain-containing protein, partial [Gammaproteobacteria bacterium]|nr:DUF2092 domain-containing protein [Gammaproteobacteria bacterium]